MATKTPNLNKGRTAWNRLQSTFRLTVAIQQGVISARRQQMIDLRKR
jgi:hypothetical protein